MTTLAEQWTEFALRVVPPDATPLQRQEMKRSFMAGAAVAFEVAVAIGHDSVSEDAGARALASLDAELRAFAEAVRSGRA